MNRSDNMTVAVRGMSWMLVNLVISRAVVFLSQLILGFLLLPSDFGIYALALSVTNALSSIRNGGTAQILVQRSNQYEQIVSPVTQFALILNVVALLVLLAMAPLANASLKTTEVGLLAAFIGLSFPLGTLAATFRTELAVYGRFREVAILNTLSTVLWQIEVIVLAKLGYGAYSYAVPIVLQSVLDGVLGWYFVRKWPMRRPLITWVQFKSLFRETGWVMLGAAMLSLGLTGHYFAAGLFTDAATVGWFFFGFQLVMALFVVLNSAIEAVLPPTFARLNDAPERQSQVVMSMLGVLMVVSLPIAGALFISARAIIHILWHGRWDTSAQVVSITALSIPAWVIIAVVRALLEARGMWRSRFVLLGIYGAGTFAVVAIAATTGNVSTIATYLSSFYCLLATVLLVYLSLLVDVPWRAVFKTLVFPAALCLTCVLIALFIVGTLPKGTPFILCELVKAAAFGLFALGANLIVFRRTWRSGLTLLRGRRQEAV